MMLGRPHSSSCVLVKNWTPMASHVKPFIRVANTCCHTRFAQCEHVMDKLMQRGEQMESKLPAAAFFVPQRYTWDSLEVE